MVATVAAESGVDPGRTRSSRRLWSILLVAGYAVQVAWRLRLSLPQTGAVIHDDEDGYLLVARILAGGPGASLPSFSIMRPMGYPLLLAPIYWFAQQPVHVYVGVHIVNALVSAANFPLLYLIGRRVLATGRAATAAVAFVLTALPALVFYSEYALTDVLLPVLLELFLLAVHAMLTGRRPILAGVVAGFAAAYAANTHVRGLVILVALAGLLVVGAWRRWLPWSVTTAAAGGAAIVYVAGNAINRWLEGQLFPGTGAFNVDSRAVGRITSLSGLFRVLGDGLGQIWYLCASTYGLAGLGLAAAIVMVLRREGPRATRIVLGLTVLMNLGVAFATATGIPDEGRINKHFSGRYVSLFAGVWSLVALTTLARASWGRAALLVGGAAAIEVGSLGVAWLYAHRGFPHEKFISFDAADLSFLSHDYHRLHLVEPTLLSFGFMVGFVVLFARGRPVRVRGRSLLDERHRLAVVGLGGLLVLSLAAVTSMTNWVTAGAQAAQYRPGPAELVRDAHVPVGSSVEEAANVPWQINQRHQREVYWQRLVTFDPAGSPPGQPAYAIALDGWPGALYGYTAEIVVREADRPVWVVWRLR
ncbi:MAG: hypothetical protein ACM3JP_00500 [Betaproteobacteria bacterium]